MNHTNSVTLQSLAQLKKNFNLQMPFMTLPRLVHNKCPSSANAAPYFYAGLLDKIHTSKRLETDQAELLAIWEDQMDALGSSPNVEDLQHLVDLAPSKSHPLYSFAIGVLAAIAFTKE